MSTATAVRSTVRRPALGGFTPTFVLTEIRRVLRNRRTLVFIVLMPPLFFILFGLPQRGQEFANGSPVTGYIMISLAVYGAMVATTSAGAMVGVERSQGWSRQLRLTPLRPAAYVAAKVTTALVLGLLAVLVEFAVGAVSGVRLPVHVWLYAGLAAWLGSLVFAAFGLFVGYLAPAENVLQIMGPVLSILAMLGGLFVPLEVLPVTMRHIAAFTPVYGVGQIARAPLTGGGFNLVAAANVVAWTAVFGLGAARLFRRDTARV